MKGIGFYRPRKGKATSQRGGWRTFCDNNSGAALLEFAFLTPILMLLITGIIQFGSLFFLENNMANVARDTARRLSVGEMTTPSEAQTYAQNQLVNWGATFTINVTEPNPPTSTDYVVQISVPIADASIVDPFGFMDSGNLSTQFAMRQE